MLLKHGFIGVCTGYELSLFQTFFQKDRVKAKATIIEAGGNNDIR